MYVNSHCAHVRVETRKDDLSSVGATIDRSKDVVGHEIAVVVVNVSGGHVLEGTGVLDLDIEANVTRELLKQLQGGEREREGERDRERESYYTCITIVGNQSTCM